MASRRAGAPAVVLLLLATAAHRAAADCAVGASLERPATSCFDALELCPSLGASRSSVFIRPDPAGPAFRAMCVGGWTVAAVINGSTQTWLYDSPLWTTNALLNDAWAAGPPGVPASGEAKLRAFNARGWTALRLVHVPSWGTVDTINLRASASLTQLFSSPASRSGAFHRHDCARIFQYPGFCGGLDAGNGSSVRVNLEVEARHLVPETVPDWYGPRDPGYPERYMAASTYYRWRLGRSISDTAYCSSWGYFTRVSAWGIGIGGELACTNTSGRAVHNDASIDFDDSDTAQTDWRSAYAGEALYSCPSNWSPLPSARDRFALLVTTEVRRGGFTGPSLSPGPAPSPSRTRTRTHVSRSRTPSPTKSRSAGAASKSCTPTRSAPASRSRSRKRKLR